MSMRGRWDSPGTWKIFAGPLVDSADPNDSVDSAERARPDDGSVVNQIPLWPTARAKQPRKPDGGLPALPWSAWASSEPATES
jgi:hypothetical protein